MDPVTTSGQRRYRRVVFVRMFERRFARVWGASLVIFLAVSLFPWQALVAAEGAAEKSLLLTRDDGLSIVDTIAEQGQSTRRRGPKPDCSHLVNAIYARAGFPYPYAKSADLYRGEPSFVRVSAPQPGDLIVWRGHVGLVTDPRSHLFYSSLRSGIETEDYTSAYWRRKGAPRFYRYRSSERSGFLTASERRARDDREGDGYQNQLANRSNTPRIVAVNQISKNEMSSEDEEEGQTGSESSPDTGTASKKISNSRRRDSAPEAKPSVPSNVLLPTGRDKPTVQQVDEAIGRFQEAVVKAVDAEALLHWRSPVILVKQVQVQRLEFKGKKAYALVTVDADAGIQRGVVDRFVRHEEQRWELARSKSGWTLNPPAAALYIPQQTAVHLFAQELAQATEGNSSSGAAQSQQSMLASLLNELLN